RQHKHNLSHISRASQYLKLKLLKPKLLAFVVICLLGCTFHVYHISAMYFAFHTTAMVTYEVPRKMIVPAISVSIPLMNFLSRSRMSAEFPEFLKELQRRQVGES